MSKTLPTRAEYRFFLPIPTRWMDNDIYGHINNVTYYSYFDTVVARFLLGAGAINLVDSPVIGVVVETLCRFHAPMAFPDEVTAGLRVERLGNTSIRYGIGLFRGAAEVVSAEGHFVHVYVDRATQRQPTPLPPALREAAARLIVAA
ncbi:acyl-CoA thioesterase [Falsiroseomonas selenitidurans]|uniref:Acyl-CoA thioesterase n=1 Tax=Falsiroseomonas selenitidurans TaxID=2716335 RepID=A0ABX1EAS7_9PROT|nr:thioesterase family protein [Falsiroseomonas selenitidurans]NKC32892.1 acyl-CoA thioesterase [Falsiroseomonas selenitidurans]